MNEDEIKARFRSKMEELAYQSTGNGTDKYGNPVTNASFWDDAGGIFDEALDGILALKE